jgi:hypothetical protein
MRVRLVLVPLVAAVALLAGCVTKNATDPPTTTAPASNGVAALSADQILAKAKAALTAAKSFHVKGEATEDKDTFTLDLKVAGGNFAGTIAAEGNSFELVGLGDDVYMKPDEKFLATLVPPGDQAMAALFKGKYLKGKVSDPQLSGFKDLIKVDEMLKADGSLTKGQEKTFNGAPAIGLVDSSDSSVLYIATTGEPLPLGIADKAGQNQLTFSEFNATFDIKAPPAAEVLDMSALTGK